MAGSFISSVTDPMVGDFKSTSRQIKDRWNRITGKSPEDSAMYGVHDVNMQGHELVNIVERFIANGVNAIEDPAFDFIQLQIAFDGTDGLFGAESNTDTALHFLKAIGDEDRYKKLRQVIDILKSIFGSDNNVKSYYLQQVDGLGAMNDNRRKRGTSIDLTLQMLEDIKHTIRTVNYLLEDVLYDSKKQLSVLPINLQYFNCLFIIKDCRDLSVYTVEAPKAPVEPADGTAPADSQQQQAKADADANELLFVDTDNGNQLQSFMVSCYCCRWNPKPVPDSINNQEGVMATGNLQFSTKCWHYEAIYPAIAKAVESANLLELQEQELTLKQRLANAAKTAATAMVASYVNSIYSSAKSMLMGGAYKLLEQSGVTKYANMAMKYTKGGLVGEELAGMLQKAMAQDIVNGQYFTDSRPVQQKTGNGTGYFTDLRLLNPDN